MSINKTEKPQQRYKHWFWNSKFIGFLEGISCRTGSYLWCKQYGGNQ